MQEIAIIYMMKWRIKSSHHRVLVDNNRTIDKFWIKINKTNK